MSGDMMYRGKSSKWERRRNKGSYDCVSLDTLMNKILATLRGKKMSERELSKQFRVSPQRIRLALSKMSSSGQVSTAPNKSVPVSRTHADAPADYAEFYTNWKKFCLKYFNLRLRSLYSEDETEEVLHEFFAFSMHLKMLEKFDPQKSAWTTWLRKCMFNFSVRVLKKRSRRVKDSEGNDRFESMEAVSLNKDSVYEGESSSYESSLLRDTSVELEQEAAFRSALMTVFDLLESKDRSSVVVEYPLPGGGTEKGTRSSRTLLRMYELGFSRQEICEYMQVENLWFMRKQIQEAARKASLV